MGNHTANKLSQFVLVDSSFFIPAQNDALLNSRARTRSLCTRANNEEVPSMPRGSRGRGRGGIAHHFLRSFPDHFWFRAM